MATSKNTNKTTDEEKIKQKIEQDLKKEYEKKIKELEERLEKASTVKDSIGYKFIPDDTKIRIKSNTGGIFTFNEDRGKIRVFFQMDNYGETAVISYDELRIFNSSKPSFIKKGIISIVEVYSDCGITLEDVINDLKLEKTYFDKNKFNPIDLEDMFDDKKVSDDEFNERLFNSPEMSESIIEVAYKLYKSGKFSNYTKMNSLRQFMGNPNLFK